MKSYPHAPSSVISSMSAAAYKCYINCIDILGWKYLECRNPGSYLMKDDKNQAILINDFGETHLVYRISS